MKKYYVETTENEVTTDSEYDTLEEALLAYEKDLDDLSHYNFYCNRNTIISLSVAVFFDEDENDSEWDCLSSCKVSDYADLSFEEKEKLFVINE